MKLYILSARGDTYDDDDDSFNTLIEKYEITDLEINNVLFDCVGSYPSHSIKIPLDNDEEFTATIDTFDLGDVNKDAARSALWNVYNFFYNYSKSNERDLYIRFSDEWSPRVEKDKDDNKAYEVKNFN